MKHLKNYRLFEETAMATMGNTGGMGAVVAPQPGAVPGTFGTSGSGDVVANNTKTGYKIDAKTKKTSKKKTKRTKRGIGESTQDKETMYVTRFQDWDYPKESVSENLDLTKYFKTIWSKDKHLIQKVNNDPTLKNWIKYVNYTDDEWDRVSDKTLKELWDKWDKIG